MIWGVKPISIFDLNMLLQIIIFAFFLVGIFYVKRTKIDLRKHRLFMGIAIMLNAISIFLIMGRSFLAYFDLLVERMYEITPFITWIHVMTGGVAEVLGIIFLFRHPRTIRRWMRITAALWVSALVLGIFFYIYYYL